MWNITMRNIQFRRRQFLIAVVGTALVFAMALLVTGIRQGLHTEARSTMQGIGGDSWVVKSGGAGPFTSFSVLPAATAQLVATAPGVRQADPVLLVPQTVRRAGKFESMNVIGHRLGGLGEPPVLAGRRSAARGEVVADEKLGFKLGESFKLAGRTFRVVGLVRGRTYYGGTGTAFMAIEDVQALAFQGAPLATAVVMKGGPKIAPAGLRVMSERQVEADLLSPLANAEKSMSNTRILLWIVAAVIVGGVMYMSALERVRDFAVLKAVGAPSRVLVVGLVAEAMIACAAAAGLAIIVAGLLRPTLPLPVTFTTATYEALPVVAVAVGVIASLAGIRRAVRTDPAAAFGGA